MGRHSRKDSAPARPRPEAAPPEPEPEPEPFTPGPVFDGAPGARRSAEATVSHRGYAPPARPGPPGARPGGHPEQREPGGAWGAEPAPASAAVHGDWRGAPRAAAPTPPAPTPPVRGADAPVRGADTPVRDARIPVRDAGMPARDTDTPAFGTPAVGFPRVTVAPPPPAPDPLTSTGSHRRVPGPRRPQAPETPAGSGAAEPSAPARGARIRTYTGMAAAAVTTVLAVVVAGQVVADSDSAPGNAHAAGDDAPERSLSGQSAASRSDGRATPANPPAAAAQPQTYEQQMARQLPIDAKLAGPGTFDTVPGFAKAPGKGKVVRYRVDVEQGLGLDPQLFAEAVQRTLNDPRSWGHGGAMTFERVPAGEADFVITLASPGTTGTWCAKSGLDTTVDNVSCDSAATERVMINAFRWAQGSPTYGPDQMLAYRQMLINHEVGHRLGHGHVSCQTPGSLAPIMQQQTKSLDIDNIHCLPNPWVFPGS
ncbi:DUF3152 domain-containing protein [Streptomyces lavendulae]|uniref:DUF3152 domain-containing protein n=1 Tax=Streptomyces lavendulae TaxID=1914 RepID=UPI0033DB211A